MEEIKWIYQKQRDTSIIVNIYSTQFDKEQNGIDITPLTYRSEKIDVTCTFPPFGPSKMSTVHGFLRTVGIDTEHVYWNIFI